MPKFAFAALLGLVVAHDIKTQIDARLSAKLYLVAAQAYEETEAQHVAMISYLCHMIDEHGIEPTEFDLIALGYNS